MPAQKVERERALGDEEIRAFWLACDRIGWPFGPLAQLLLLTAQRRDELAHATWGEFDKQTRTLPGERTKNGRAHIVYLAPLAVEIFEKLPHLTGKKGWVFTTGLGGADPPVSGFGRGRPAHHRCDDRDFGRRGRALHSARSAALCGDWDGSTRDRTACGR